MVHFGIAPLQVRRDVAMLGVIHRAVLRKGPPQLWPFFPKATRRTEGATTRSADRHKEQLQTYCTGNHLEVLKRSVLGLVEVYNALPPAVVQSSTTVKALQGQLQALVLTQARAGVEDWQLLLSPRLHCWDRRLWDLRGWSLGCSTVP